MHPLAAGALTLLVVFVGTWLLSIPRRDVSIVDIVWGLSFVAATAAATLAAPAVRARHVVTAHAAVWPSIVGTAVWIVGFAFETIGDRQLRRFRADPAHRGRVLDQGLWRSTRHPNYFGDAVQWWGVFLTCLARPRGAFGVLGPLLMTFLLVRVSGVALLERSLPRRKPDDASYVARTSAFVPRRPRPAP